MGLFGMAFSYLAFSVLHFFQFVLAVTVCGLYGVDLNRAHQRGKYTDGKWVRNPIPPFPPPPNLYHILLPVRKEKGGWLFAANPFVRTSA